MSGPSPHPWAVDALAQASHVPSLPLDARLVQGLSVASLPDQHSATPQEFADLGLLMHGELPPAWLHVPLDSCAPGFAHHEASAPHAHHKSKQRLRWTPELHQRFLTACNLLGGPEKATPKQILLQMDVTGLSLFHVKSHLQKYRIAIKGGTEGQVPAQRGRKRGSTSKAAAPESDGSAEDASDCEEELGDGSESAAASKRARVVAGAGEAAAAKRSELDPVLSNAADDTSYRGSADTLGALGTVQQVVEQRQHAAAAASVAAAEHAAAPAAAADTAVSVKQEGGKGEESGSGPPVDMAQALAVQMDLQRQLQEALEAQRQLQLKLLAHGEFIQKLIRGESGKLGSELPSNSAGGGSKDGTAAAPSNASPHWRKSKPAQSSGGADTSGGGGGGGSSKSKRAAGGKQVSGASKPSGAKKGSREQLQRSSSGNKGGISTTHLMLAPGRAHLEPAPMPRRGSGDAAAAAAGMPAGMAAQQMPTLSTLLPQPAAAQHAMAQFPQQAQQQLGGASFQVDPAEVLARLAHGMPIAQMELAALLSPTSPLTQTQREHVLLMAQQQQLMHGSQQETQQQQQQGSQQGSQQAQQAHQQGSQQPSTVPPCPWGADNSTAPEAAPFGPDLLAMLGGRDAAPHVQGPAQPAATLRPGEQPPNVLAGSAEAVPARQEAADLQMLDGPGMMEDFLTGDFL